MRFIITLAVLLAFGLPLACSSRQGQLQANAQAPQSVNQSSLLNPDTNENKETGSAEKLPLRTLRVPAGDYPDGIAYASKENKIYVSDLHGKSDTVIDAKTNQRLTTISLGGGAGNSQYDSVSDRIFVTVDGREELAEIDPSTDQVVARYPLTGCKGSHGLLIDSENRLAFAACEENSKLVVFDLQSKKSTATLSVGADPDVLAFYSSLHRLYVSAESGIITIFDERGRALERVGEGFLAPNAHTVAVDSRTHRVYWPLQNVGGKPVLRITVPSDKQQ